jgi:hypothetical protein
MTIGIKDVGSKLLMYFLPLLCVTPNYLKILYNWLAGVRWLFVHWTRDYQNFTLFLQPQQVLRQLARMNRLPVPPRRAQTPQLAAQP